MTSKRNTFLTKAFRRPLPNLPPYYTTPIKIEMSPTAQLGSQGPLIPRIGLGLMGMSVFYGAQGSDEDRFVVLDRALEVGETFWDSQLFVRRSTFSQPR